MLKQGEQAPDFSLPDQDGQTVTLSELLKGYFVVIFFYPKDHTPGCTEQSCSFRDQYSDFKANNAQVIGISSDSTESHKGFAQAHALPFPLLTDRDGKVGKLYDINKIFGALPGRVTFVIDKSGIIRHAFSSQFKIQSHIDQALEAILALNRGENLRTR
jgi:peroxiredoxin Q/BCP